MAQLSQTHELWYSYGFSDLEETAEYFGWVISPSATNSGWSSFITWTSAGLQAGWLGF